MQTALDKAGFSASSAEWIRLGCFIAGFVGIQAVSRFLHRFIPSHVVDCDHTHERTSSEVHSNQRSRNHSHGMYDHSRHRSWSVRSGADGGGKVKESRPLLDIENRDEKGKDLLKVVRQASFRGDSLTEQHHHSTPTAAGRR